MVIVQTNQRFYLNFGATRAKPRTDKGTIIKGEKIQVKLQLNYNENL